MSVLRNVGGTSAIRLWGTLTVAEASETANLMDMRTRGEAGTIAACRRGSQGVSRLVCQHVTVLLAVQVRWSWAGGAVGVTPLVKPWGVMARLW